MCTDLVYTIFSFSLEDTGDCKGLLHHAVKKGEEKASAMNSYKFIFSKRWCKSLFCMALWLTCESQLPLI